MERRNVDLIKVILRERTHLARPSTLEFLHDKPDSLGRGEEAQVAHASVVLQDRTVDGFAFKEYHNEGRAVHALKSYAHLKQVGLPVPHTFRLVKEGQRYSGILMTDLTQGWKNVLITSNQTKAQVIGHVFRHHPETVYLLAEYDLHNPKRLEALKAQLVSIAEKAAEHKIEFNAHDVLSAIFRSDGALEFMISDMGNVHLNSELSEGDLIRRNIGSALSIILMISEAKRIANAIVV